MSSRLLETRTIAIAHHEEIYKSILNVYAPLDIRTGGKVLLELAEIDGHDEG